MRTSQLVRMLAGMCLAGATCGVAPAALQLAIEPIAGVKTAIPEGTGTFIPVFRDVNVCEDGVYFVGRGSEKQTGIYKYQNGKLTRVVDSSMEVPDMGGKFRSFSGALSKDGKLAYAAITDGGKYGVFSDIFGSMKCVFKSGDSVPGGERTFQTVSLADIGDDKLLVAGDWNVRNLERGVYVLAREGLEKVCEKGDTAPGKLGTIEAIMPARFQGERVIVPLAMMKGQAARAEMAICAWKKGRLEPLVDTLTLYPGIGHFKFVSRPSLNDGGFAFFGDLGERRFGNYLYSERGISALPNHGDEVDGYMLGTEMSVPDYGGRICVFKSDTTKGSVIFCGSDKKFEAVIRPEAVLEGRKPVALYLGERPTGENRFAFSANFTKKSTLSGEMGLFLATVSVGKGENATRPRRLPETRPVNGAKP